MAYKDYPEGLLSFLYNTLHDTDLNKEFHGSNGTQIIQAFGLNDKEQKILEGLGDLMGESGSEEARREQVELLMRCLAEELTKRPKTPIEIIW